MIRTRRLNTAGITLMGMLWSVTACLAQSAPADRGYDGWQDAFDKAYRAANAQVRPLPGPTRNENLKILSYLPAVPDIPIGQQLGRQSLPRPEANRVVNPPQVRIADLPEVGPANSATARSLEPIKAKSNESLTGPRSELISPDPASPFIGEIDLNAIRQTDPAIEVNRPEALAEGEPQGPIRQPATNEETPFLPNDDNSASGKNGGTAFQVYQPVDPPAEPDDRDRNVPQIIYPDSDEPFWWESIIRHSLDDRPANEVFVEKLIHEALLNSPRILAISQTPLIQETEIGEAVAEFDPELFVKTQFDDRVDPVGNTLTTGGLPFLEDHIWYANAGVRRKLYSGGTIELNQRLGFQNSNSRFFDPQDQGTATLSLNFSQPLLRGRGKFVNRSQVIIAQLGQGVAWDRMADVLQQELVAVVEAYWSLYYSRSVLLQKLRNVQRGEAVLQKLEARAGLDSLPSQINRARAAVQSRRTEMANAIRDVRNAETELRRVTGSPEVFQAVGSQLVPVEPPVKTLMNGDLQPLITTAIEKRPEVRQALKRGKIAAVNKDVSCNDLLPELTMIFNTYVSALEGDTRLAKAWGRQFSGSTPGYAVGLEFSYPWRNRAAQKRFTRQQVLVNQIRNEIDLAIQDVIADTKVSWRQIVSSHETMKAARESIEAAQADLDQNHARWESFALVEGDLADGQNPTTLLDQLLDAQQRLANAELTYSQAVLDFKNAEVHLKRATGTLFDYQQITFCTVPTADGPAMQINAGEIEQH